MHLTLSARLKSALTRTDPSGRFFPTDIHEIRVMAEDLVNRGGAVHLEPPELLGPWPELPAQVQTYLRAWAEEEIRGSMAFHPRGLIWPAAIRGIHTLGQFLGQRKRLGALNKVVMKWSPRLWRRPQMTRAAVLEGIRRRRWSKGRRPRIEDLFTALGKDAYWIMGGYAEGVRIDSRCRGFFHDPGKNAVWGYLLGLDLVTTPSGVVCHEANLSPGLHERIRRGYWERDPIPIGLAEFADRHELRRILWIGSSQTPIEPWFYSQLRDGLSARGIGLEVLEDVRLPIRSDIPPNLPVPGRALFPPSDPPSDTLVVRLCSYRVGPDFLLSNKGAFSRALGHELERSGEARVKVLPLTPDPGEVFLPEDPGSPNLVYKYPLENQGTGVFFLRARDTNHAQALAQEVDRATGDRGGLFQPWVSSNLLTNRRIYEHRTIILVTPLGIEYLGARRRETATPLPERAVEGIMEDRRPFIITGFFGNVSVPVDPAQEPLLEAASVAMGEAIARVISRGFITLGRT